jgi:hypothetical protein
MKNAVFWGVAPCRCGRLNRRFGGSYRLHLQGRKNPRAKNLREQVAAELASFFYPEDGGDTILRNVGSIDHIYTAPHPRRRHSSNKNKFYVRYTFFPRVCRFGNTQISANAPEL